MTTILPPAKHEEALLHERRPTLHLTPRAGWMNDPNGLFFVDGTLHVTFQHNPDEARWGTMHWGHASSRDLLTWRHHPNALSPREGRSDAAGCWSGSIVATPERALAFYTGVVVEGEFRRQVVCRAASTDPERARWTADPDGAVIADAPSGIAPDLFRDPFVFRDGDAGWQMLVGAGTEDGHAAVVRYRSPDLDRWTPAGVVLASSQLDPAAGADAPMWECPQLIRLDGTDVLIVSIVDRTPGIRPSHVTAFTGHLRDDGFEVRHAQQLGLGPDIYAPSTCRTPDGRALLFGWVPEDPPEAGSDRDWAGALTFPRVVTIRDDDGLSLSLAEEVAAARHQRVSAGPVVVVPEAEPRRPAVPEGPFELLARLEPEGHATAVLELRDSDTTPLARITWQADHRVLSAARRGIVSVAGRSAMTAGELPAADGRVLELRVLVDGSIVELEANGHTMATLRLPAHASVEREVAISALDGPVRIHEVVTWALAGPDSMGSDARTW